VVTVMFGASIIRHIREAAKRFVGANQGNIAVIFTIAAVPVIGFVGAAIDYSRANMARSSMQAALDSTALMLSKDISSGKIASDAGTVLTTAQNYFAGLYTNKDATAPGVTPPSVAATYTANNGNLGNTIMLTATGTINTDFMKVMGLIVPGSNFSQMSFSTNSTTAWGNVKMRVALVLDNTGSMAQNNKITALRNAVAGSGGLIDQLSGLARNPGDVYISVIPFAKVVNAGASNYSASWIDWTDWLNPPTSQPANNMSPTTNYQANLPINWHGIGPGWTCPFTTSNSGFTCNSTPANNSSSLTNTNSNKIPTSVTYQGQVIPGPICPSVDANSHTNYNGCWTSELVNDGGVAQTFCSGSSSCSCTGAPTTTPACTCTGSGSNKVCKGPRYIHNWTQPVTSDTTDNQNQPHLNPPVGFNVQDTVAHIPATSTANPNPAWIGTGTAGTWLGTGTTATMCTSPTQLNCMTLVNNNWTKPSTNSISTWTGCITDRFQSYDETGDGPSGSTIATLFPANQYYENSTAYCSSSSNPTLEQVMPLTYTWSTLKTNVTAMQPTGGTDQSVGLAWGWQSLLQTGPIPAPAEDPNTTYNRIIILLSDGLNTEDRWPGYGDGSTQNTNSSGTGYIDIRQTQQCANIKAMTDANGRPMFTIYTIQVNTSTPADPTSTVLQNCASDQSKFFMLTSSTQIATTFTTIGTALSQLRVAR
jgi:Flp pilus assembly protein TadG